MIWSPATLIAVWNDYAAALIRRGSATADEVETLNAIAIAYGNARGICVFLSGSRRDER